MSREAMQMALEALESDPVSHLGLVHRKLAITALRQALAEPEQAEQQNTMPITDDNGKALRPQYQVVEQRGNWFLLYDQHQIGNTVRHAFRIEKLQHNILLYPGISLAEAKKRFHEKMEADNE